MPGKYPLNGSHYTEADDLEMLSHFEDWPAVLHVKRGHPATEWGTVERYPMTAVPVGLAVVEVGAAREVEDWPDALLVRTTAPDGAPHYTYKDAATMVAAGWRVD